MKIPENYFGDRDYEKWKSYYTVWDDAARQLSMEHGIFIYVRVDLKNDRNHAAMGFEYLQPSAVARIYFHVAGQDCESLNKLRQVLKNRAFL